MRMVLVAGVGPGLRPGRRRGWWCALPGELRHVSWRIEGESRPTTKPTRMPAGRPASSAAAYDSAL